MALIHRVSRLFRADFNAVLDHIEEPELLLRQSIRDMEDELADCDRRIARRRQEQVSLQGRCEAHKKSASKITCYIMLDCLFLFRAKTDIENKKKSKLVDEFM